MACLAGPSHIEQPSQRRHDITQLGSLTQPTPAARMWDVRDSASVASEASEASEASDHSCSSPRPKDQMRRCLHQYKTLALRSMDASTAKEAALWCCLGLCVAAASLSAPSPTLSPISPKSRSNSNGSIGSVSDSGFAPSVEAPQRHYLSISDPDIENMLTNLVAGLAGLWVSALLDRASGSCRVPAEVGREFDETLATLGLTKGQEFDVVNLITKIAAQLLNLVRNEFVHVKSHMVEHWELCIKLVAASANGDLSMVDSLASELEKRTPPPSLTEPALSSLLRPHGTKNNVPFPGLDLSSKFPHMSHYTSRQTRSRAASLMSHSSLCSFSSIRSLGSLSSKSPATLSLSHGVSFSQSPTEELAPAGWFISGPPRSSTDSLSRALYTHTQRAGATHRPFSLDPGHATTAPSSPLRSTAPTFSRSASSGSSEADILKPRSKGKGKENVGTGLGLRPGAEGISSRTGTRFVMTCPPTPSGSSGRKPLPKMDPVLAALERGSKLQSKSLCLNCGKKGTNYPCCPRCGETWCSRECRVEANNGGKHVCKRAA